MEGNYPRPRNQPKGSASGRGPGLEGRRGGGPEGLAPPSVTLPGGKTRAERFEDERKQVIESCFSKLDPNGQRTSPVEHMDQ